MLKSKYEDLTKLENNVLDIITEENDLITMTEENTMFELKYKEYYNLIDNILCTKYNSKEEKKTTMVKDNNSNVKLPKLEIAKFYGYFVKWQTFYDSFVSAIDKNKNISDVDKFNYLRSLVAGEALRMIEGLPLTGENYKKAMELLNERFGNKQAIITSHMNKLLLIRKISSDKDLSGIKRLYDEIEIHVRSLESLGIKGENYGSLLSPVVMERLPPDFKHNISRELKDDLWDLTKLLGLI